MNRRRRGVALITALLLSVILLLLGYAMLAVSSRAWAESRLQRDTAQAVQLARAGVELTMLRLSKDPAFPPRIGGRTTYGMMERLNDPLTGEPLGDYKVTIDVTRRVAPRDSNRTRVETYLYPNYAIRIHSQGIVYTADSHVSATHVIDAELDVSPQKRGASPDLSVRCNNPNWYRFLRWEDSGAF